MSSDETLRIWSAAPLGPEVSRSLERLARNDDVAAVAAMPDVHLANAVCVGAVVATRSRLFPDAVGGDIGCGMAAVRLGCGGDALGDRRRATEVLERLRQRVPTTQHRSATATLPESLHQRPLSCAGLEAKKSRIGRVQFATLGRGNHFVEFQRDAAGQLWLMVHSGSRGIGQAIRQHHGGDDGNLSSIEARTSAGRRYLHDVEWALEYARLSRRQMAEAVNRVVGEVLGARTDWESYFDCHHNFVRREDHGGETLWVHRKGAISARDGEAGIIPGSMGAPSFHTRGRGNARSLCSSSHGAGRIMSRSEARRVISTARLGAQMRGVWFDNRIANRLRDEAPGAYKDIRAVMRAQRELTAVVRRLEPVLVYKGT